MKIIKYLRYVEGITQKDLAKKLGISRNYLSEIESGKVTPSINILISLCNHFKSHPCVFLCGRLNKDIPICINCDLKKIMSTPEQSFNNINEIRHKIEEGVFKVKFIDGTE